MALLPNPYFLLPTSFLRHFRIRKWELGIRELDIVRGAWAPVV